MAMSRSRPERLWQDLLPGRDRHAREQSGLGVGIGGGEGFGGLPVGKIDHQQRADHRLAVLAEQRAGGEYLAADAAEMSEMGVAIGLADLGRARLVVAQEGVVHEDGLSFWNEATVADRPPRGQPARSVRRSEEHTSELQSLMR